MSLLNEKEDDNKELYDMFEELRSMVRFEYNNPEPTCDDSSKQSSSNPNPF
jgi:hypothetical protein